MPLDLPALRQDPNFLAMSPEAKGLYFNKNLPGFDRLSPEAKTLFVEKHFPREATASTPTKSFWSRAGEAALRTGGPMVVGALTSAAAPEGIPLTTMAGMAMGSAIVSKYYKDPPREALTEAGTSAAFGTFGPGKTALRGAVKFAGLGAGSTVIDEIAHTGELPTKGQLALSALIGGTVGYFGKALPDWLSKKLTSRAHIEEILPKDIAADAEKVLGGKPVKGVPAEDLNEIRKLRIRLRDVSGKFRSKAETEQTLRPGTERIKTTTSQVVRGAKGRYQRVETTSAREITREDIFPEYKPEEPTERGALHEGTAVTAGLSRPRWLAAHVQDQTGVPVYDDIYRPLRATIGDRERTAVEVERITNKYLKDRSLDPAVKDIIARYVTASHGLEEARGIAYAIKRVGKLFGKEIPDDVARRWRYNLISSPYAAGIPLRLGSMMRVFAHTFQIGVAKTGWPYLIRGMTRAMTREGWQEAIRAGAIGAEHLSIPEEVLGAGRDWYRRALQIGFGPFRYSQDLSRASIFHAASERAKDALRAAKTFEQFVDKAGLDVGIPRPEVAKAEFLWRQGRHAELTDHVGVVHVDSYIPGHSNLDRPFVGSGVLGGQATGIARGARPVVHGGPRFALQFLNWPSFYGQTLFENFRPGAGPRGKQAAMFARWVLANSALGVVAYELYGEGEKALEKAAWLTGLGPLFYSFGPGVSDVQGISSGARKAAWTGPVETVFGDDADVGKKHMMQGFRQVGRSLPIPFKGALKDLSDYQKQLLGEEE